MNAPRLTCKPFRQPPWTVIFLGHAIGSVTLGALLPSGEHLQGLHAVTLPMLQWNPGAMAISKQAFDPVFAQVFLVLSMLIALCILIGAVWHMSRGGYHTKTFDSRKEWWRAELWVWSIATVFILIAWGVPYSIDGAQTRSHFLILAAISSKLGVLTAMNFFIVWGPFFFMTLAITGPFHISVRSKSI
jgi:hypothetical protein